MVYIFIFVYIKYTIYSIYTWLWTIESIECTTKIYMHINMGDDNTCLLCTFIYIVVYTLQCVCLIQRTATNADYKWQIESQTFYITCKTIHTHTQHTHTYIYMHTLGWSSFHMFSNFFPSAQCIHFLNYSNIVIQWTL